MTGGAHPCFVGVSDGHRCLTKNQKWNPYVPDLVEPLAQYADKVARRHGHRRPQAFSLLDYAEELRRDPDQQPPAPAVLLIDPWAVTQPETRRLLETFDAVTKPWIQFVIAWNPRDDELEENQESLRETLSTVLGRKLSRGRAPSPLGVSSIEQMSAVLPSMIETAGRHFLRNQKPSVAEE